MSRFGNKNSCKFTEEKVEKIFEDCEKLLSINENGKYKFCSFKEIEKLNIVPTKGFTYLVGKFPQFRKRMFGLIIRAEQNEKINNLIQIQNNK